MQTVAKTSVVDGTWLGAISSFENTHNMQRALLSGMNIFAELKLVDGKVTTHVPALVPINSTTPPVFSITGGYYSAQYGTFTVTDNKITVTIDSRLIVADGLRIITEGLKPYAVTPPLTATCNYVINGNTLTLTDSAGNTVSFIKQ